MGELVKLNIYMEVGDDWAWVAQGAKRQPVDAVAALGGAEDAPDVDEGAQAVPAPIHAPPPPSPAAGRTMPQRLGRHEEEIQGLRYDVGSLRGLAFDGTFRGSYPTVFERRTRQRTNGASMSTAQQDEQQPDP
ncbi:hypothetical protein Tco_0527931 [Tanacetum coccineum]